eukprot:CAMPEP_0195522422 /NCGR_PEP_ID=MMETSP0794_2-20130614/20596_1 /TAXON_ID=515487 /ORGANISM="Stephanopyxis turris, Strain CCMP 815" /LENGTH=415 /DNA_ID=CAMNT_0040652179 /DNA_START=282 /DNA_END=1529 /DNA_ORIENTATION=+
MTLLSAATALGNHNENDENKETGAEMERDTDWVRAHELDAFQGKRPQLFEGDIEPDDLCQGAVGDCWLVAAFASAAENPDCIRSLFKTKEYNPRGLYEVRIFDPIKEKFELIKVDDRIPCKKGTKKPRFMEPNGSELWAIILEKAYAKFCGSYAKLNGGFVLWGWLSMTGDNVFQMSRKPDNTWFREDMVAIEDAKDKRACGFRKTNEVYSNENLWTLLKKYDKQKALMSGSIGKTDYGKFSGPNGEQLLEGEGLVAGHAYSLIAAIEVTDGPRIGGGKKEKFRLLQLRNPWGTFEWKGDWSDKSDLWNKHPYVKKALNFVDADDGAFWISFEDFSSVYTRVNICDRTTSNDASLDVMENDGCCGIGKVGFVVVPSFGFAVKVSETFTSLMTLPMRHWMLKRRKDVFAADPLLRI